MSASTHLLPPFSSVLKSREVEDPVNLWLHRPLAYGFVAATFRTPITPNMITVLAVVVGMTAGAFAGADDDAELLDEVAALHREID